MSLPLIQPDQHAVIDTFTGLVVSLHTTALEAHQQLPKVAPFMPHPGFAVRPVRITVEPLPQPAPVQQLTLRFANRGGKYAHAPGY